jgi:hypothetical protein
MNYRIISELAMPIWLLCTFSTTRRLGETILWAHMCLIFEIKKSIISLVSSLQGEHFFFVSPIFYTKRSLGKQGGETYERILAIIDLYMFGWSFLVFSTNASLTCGWNNFSNRMYFNTLFHSPSFSQRSHCHPKVWACLCGCVDMCK